MKADPVDEPDLYWFKQSIMNYSFLFVDDEKYDGYGKEQDLLDNVYSFIKQSKRLSNTKATSYV